LFFDSAGGEGSGVFSSAVEEEFFVGMGQPGCSPFKASVAAASKSRSEDVACFPRRIRKALVFSGSIPATTYIQGQG